MHSSGGQRPECFITIAAIFAASLGISLVLYGQFLNTTFVFDDLSHLAMATQRSVAGCLRPVSNGFWRPLNLWAFQGIHAAAGLTPWPYHLSALIVHAGVATLTAWFAWRVLESRTAAVVAATFVTIHPGGHSAVIQLCNACDSMAVFFMLGGLLAWDSYLREGRMGALVLTYASFLLGLMSKEIALTVPFVLLIYALIFYRPKFRGALPHLIVMIALSAAGSLAICLLQRRQESYLSARLMGINLGIPVRFVDYFTSAYVPFLHVLEWPFAHPRLPRIAFWLVRLGAIAILILVIRRCAKSPGQSVPAVLFALSAMAILLTLPSFVRMPPQSRYLYPAIPFAAVTCAAMWLHGRMWRAALVVLSMVMIASFFASGTFRDYMALTKQVNAFVSAAKAESGKWTDGKAIAIRNHPFAEVGEQSRWVYSQLLFDLHLEGKRVRVELPDDASPPSEGTRMYWFDGLGLKGE